MHEGKEQFSSVVNMGNFKPVMQPANLQRRVATIQPQGNWPMLRAWLQHDNDSDYDYDYVSI